LTPGHRETLRALCERALALRSEGAALGLVFDDDLARLLEAAAAAVTRVAGLDRLLGDGAVATETDDGRAHLRERDLGAARLYQLVAQLDALRARLAALRALARLRADEASVELEDVRAQLDALREVLT
jgi:hypothetical protein